jgi:hypothetical protein
MSKTRITVALVTVVAAVAFLLYMQTPAPPLAGGAAPERRADASSGSGRSRDRRGGEPLGGELAAAGSGRFAPRNEHRGNRRAGHLIELPPRVPAGSASEAKQRARPSAPAPVDRADPMPLRVQAPQGPGAADVIDGREAEDPSLTYDGGDETVFATHEFVDAADDVPVSGQAGSISFWVDPQWKARSEDDADLVDIGNGALRVTKNVDLLRFAFTDTNGQRGAIAAPIPDWQAGLDHLVTVTWSGVQKQLYIDGELVSQGTESAAIDLPDTATLRVGSSFAGQRPVASAWISGLQVRTRPLSQPEITDLFTAKRQQ